MKNIALKSMSIALALLAMGGGVIGYVKAVRPSSIESPAPTEQAQTITRSEFELNQTMRKLWEEHSIYTEAAIIGILNDAPGTDKSKERLLRNPKDMADIFRRYYSDQDAKEFESLMKDHLTIAVEVVEASKAEDQARISDAEKRWFDNAAMIAEFMNGINPSGWPKDEINSMLNEHLNLLKQETSDLISKNFDGSIATFDKIENQVLGMADAFSEGIVKQFPDRFRNR